MSKKEHYMKIEPYKFYVISTPSWKDAIKWCTTVLPIVTSKYVLMQATSLFKSRSRQALDLSRYYSIHCDDVSEETLDKFFRLVNPKETVKEIAKNKISSVSRVDLNAQDADGNTVLHHLANIYYGCELPAYLLIKGADANLLNKNGEPPLKYKAADLTSASIALIRATSVENLNKVYADGETIFTTFLNKGDDYDAEDVCQALIDAGANPNILNKTGHSPLYYLIKDIKQMDEWSVHFHTRFKNLFMLLVNNGARCTDKEVEELDLLNIRDKCYLLLAISENTQLKTVDENGNTLLHQFIQEGYGPVSTVDESGYRKTVEKCIALSDINACNKNGETALELAVRDCSGKTIAKLLIEAGADLSFVNPLTRETLLHRAVDSDVIQTLVDSEKIDINAQDRNGNTALHIKLFKRDIKNAKKLLQSGANWNIQNDAGITSYLIAKQHYPQIALICRNFELEAENKALKQEKQVLQSTLIGHHQVQGPVLCERKTNTLV